MQIRRMRFNRARVKSIIRDYKETKKKPSWADTIRVSGDTLFINQKEVVPNEDVDQWLRQRAYKKEAPIALSRDSGYTDHIAEETIGISRRKWFDWLSRQDIHQRFSARPKPTKLAGRKLKNFGFLEMDLVEVKSKDVPTRKTDTYIFTMIDRLSSYLVAKRVDTKTVNPPKKRGTLIVFKELLAEMQRALPTPIREISSDSGGEFKAELGRFMKARGIEHRVVPLGAAIESRNGVIQRHMYKLINLNRKGGLDKHIRDAVHLCNATTSKVIKVRPSDAVQMEASEIEGAFNNTRQRPGKALGSKITKGDTVVVLDSKAVKKKGAFYKSYRDHWSKPGIVEKVRGHGIFVSGKSWPRNRVKKVKPLDLASVRFLEPPARVRKAKKKAEAPVLRKRSTRSTKKLYSDRKKE